MYEVPAGVAMSVPLSTVGAFNASWFRMTDLMEDSPESVDDQADLFYVEVPVTTTYAVGMWAVGFKLKDIMIGDRLKNEFPIMYAEGTLFEAWCRGIFC